MRGREEHKTKGSRINKQKEQERRRGDNSKSVEQK